MGNLIVKGNHWNYWCNLNGALELDSTTLPLLLSLFLWPYCNYVEYSYSQEIHSKFGGQGHDVSNLLTNGS